MLLNLILVIYLFILPTLTHAYEMIIESDEREFNIPLDQFDVDIEWTGEKTVPLFISISQNSLTWKSLDDGNKLPQLILSLNIDQNYKVYFKYQGKTFIPETKSNSHIYITTDIFSPDLVEIVLNGKVIGNIKVSPNLEYFRKKYVYIDHSCLPFNLSINDSVDLYTSIACHFYPNFKREGVLDVSYLPSISRLQDKSPVPYHTQITTNGTSRLDLFHKNQAHQVKIKASVPLFVPKLKTALGYGPYYFKTTDGNTSSEDHLAATYMLYAKYDLSPSTSIRAFDALINTGAVFNNFGGYFAYELGSSYDRRFTLVPLLGFQSVSFRPDKESKMLNQMIFPQGGELVYKHAFGMKNHHLIYGMFLSASSTVSYKNIWVRFGKRIFWELNWINWNFENNDARMWGLSVGLPFLSF